jgi:hypothetical protein
MIMYYRIKDGSTVYQEIVKWCGSKGKYGVSYKDEFDYQYNQVYHLMMEFFKKCLAERVEGNTIYFRHTSIECKYRIESHAGCMTTDHFYFVYQDQTYGIPISPWR